MRFHLFPSRTQKLSSLAPKILGWKRPGKIGQCQYKLKCHLFARWHFSISIIISGGTFYEGQIPFCASYSGIALTITLPITPRAASLIRRRTFVPSVFIGSRAASILSKRILLSFLSVIQRMTVRRRPSFILCCGMASLPFITAPRITAVRCSPSGSSSPSRSPAVSS